MKTIYIGIDNTICITHGFDYENAKPIQKRIDKINKLYNEGNRVIYWFNRNIISGRDNMTFSYDQLNKWGCKFHQVKSNKPTYDLFIDNKNITSKSFFSCE